MTILTKQSACDEKAPVKIAIPPEEPNQHQPEGEVPLNNNNNNTIIYVSDIFELFMYKNLYILFAQIALKLCQIKIFVLEISNIIQL